MSITMEHVNAATRENEYITTLPSVMNKLITDEKDTLNKLNKISPTAGISTWIPA